MQTYPHHVDHNIHHGHHHVHHESKNSFLPILNAISVIGWFLVALAGYFMAKARPDYYFDQHFNTTPLRTWDTESMKYAFYSFVAVFIISSIGLIINAYGHHLNQKKNYYRANLVFLLIASIICIFLYLF